MNSEILMLLQGISRKYIKKEYEELEYIKCTGEQRSDLQIMNSRNLYMEDEFYIDDLANAKGFLIGGRANFDYGFGMFVDGTSYYMSAYGTGFGGISLTDFVNKWNKVTLSVSGCTLNDEPVTLLDSSKVPLDYKLIPESQSSTIYLDTIITGGVVDIDRASKHRRRKLFIRDEDTGEVLIDAIPVRILATGEVGRLNKITGQLIPNEGTAPYEAGPVKV